MCKVPPTPNPLHDTEYEELQRLIDPLTSTCGKEPWGRKKVAAVERWPLGAGRGVI